MSVLRILIFSAAILSSAASIAGDCDPVDFSAEMGPVRNQGKTGWCYAFTAADLIGFEIGITPAEQVSAADVAAATYLENPRELEARSAQMSTANLGYVAQFKRNMLVGAVRSLDANQAQWWGMPLAAREGGFEHLAIAVYNMRGGACLESKVASQKSEIFLNSGEFLWGKYGFKRYSGVDENTVKQPPIENLRLPGASESSKCRLTAELEDVLSPDLERHLNELVASQANAEMKRACIPRRPLGKTLLPQYIQVGSANTSKSAAFVIESNLNRHRPTGIDYSACFLNGGPDLGVGTTACSHASSVVGRRINQKTGVCEYKIRNSWGSSCDNYRKDLKANCENGNIWVSRAEVTQNLQGVTSMMKESEFLAAPGGVFNNPTGR